ncbi:MAG: hypothetical protein ACPHID_04050 [Thermoplasmatota archaeon]
MARGVSKDFINLLFDDALSARGRIIVGAVLLVILTALAALLWMPWGIAGHLVAAGAGLGLGWAVAAGKVGRYEHSLRDQWNDWMRLAPACDTVADVGRKVAGRRIANRAYVIAGVLTVLWVSELLLVALWFNDTSSLWLSASVIAANGLFAGALLGHQMRLMTWTKTFANSLAEMMRDGEIGVWGSQ